MTESWINRAGDVNKDIRLGRNDLGNICGHFFGLIALVDIFGRIAHHDFDHLKAVTIGFHTAINAAANNAATQHSDT